MTTTTSRPNSVATAEQAVRCLGKGYDVVNDLWFRYCKGDDRLIEIDQSRPSQELVLPGNITLSEIPACVKCDQGDLTRFATDVISFNEMSEHFNKSLSITGKIPLGHFNSMFQFSGSWQKDASSVKALAYDGVFKSLYSLQMPTTLLTLKEEVKASMPSSWDPRALANFIENYGTHIIVGVTIGGRDVVCLKQLHGSSLSGDRVRKFLESSANERFLASGVSSHNAKGNSHKDDIGYNFINNVAMNEETILKDDMVNIIRKQRGGKQCLQSHKEWLQTVKDFPDILSMHFVPITSLLTGVTGSGFLNHAINLYLRYKPPIEELRYFLEFQLPKEWAPAFGDLPLGPPRKQIESPALQFRFMGPKLQVNTTQVTVGKRPVTGIRLHLEGVKGNRLAIHLQYLTVVPQILQPLLEENKDIEGQWHGPESDGDYSKYFEPVMWKSFSHVCTAPVETIDAWSEEDVDATIVTGAQLRVEQHGTKKVLVLWLLYTKIPKVGIRRPEWDHSPASQQKSGIFSTLLSTTFSSQQAQTVNKPAVQVNINSAINPYGPPTAKTHSPKLLKLVDTNEMTRGPTCQPGHWLVTGAKLAVENGKIAIKPKYSLLMYRTE